MKNAKTFMFRFAIVVFFITISGCDGCNNKLMKQDEKVTFEEVEDIIISDEQAKTRFANYRRHRGNIIKIYEDSGRRLGDSLLKVQSSQNRDDKKSPAMRNTSGEGFVPVQYTDYDFEHFKKYLKYVEQETKKAGADVSSIRIYFANYPENETDRDKQRRNTVLFVPTINIDGNESAYYISDEGKDGFERPFLLNDSLQRTGKPAPEHSLNLPNKTEEANLFPSAAPSPFFADKSVIGNEGGRNPPANH